MAGRKQRTIAKGKSKTRKRSSDAEKSGKRPRGKWIDCFRSSTKFGGPWTIEVKRFYFSIQTLLTRCLRSQSLAARRHVVPCVTYREEWDFLPPNGGFWRRFLTNSLSTFPGQKQLKEETKDKRYKQIKELMMRTRWKISSLRKI